MSADILLKDASVHIVGGPLIATNREVTQRGEPLQASFWGPNSSLVQIASGKIEIQGIDGGGRLHLSPYLLHGVSRIRCGSLRTDEVETPNLILGGGSPDEPGRNGIVKVINDRGEVTVELDAETGTVSAGEPLQSLSDIRCKDDVVQLSDALKTVAQLRGVRFRWRSKVAARADKRVRIGMIAQEVEDVVPEVVEERDGLRTMSYAGLVPVLVAAINEQQHEIKSQAEDLAALEQRLIALEKQQHD